MNRTNRASTPVERVLEALKARGAGPMRSRAGWSARCPAHDDKSPSLAVSVGDDGRALLHCHAGCATESVVGALALSMKDLFGDSAAQVRRVFATRDEALLAFGFGPARRVWDYGNQAGETVFSVARWDTPSGKQVRPVRHDPEGWRCRRPDGPIPLLGLVDLLKRPDEPVLVVEGEPCVDAAQYLGLLGTTSAFGARSANTADWSALAGRRVVILPDADPQGDTYANDVADLLVGVAAHVAVVRLPGLAEGEDLVDWLRERRDRRVPDNESRAELLSLVDPERFPLGPFGRSFGSPLGQGGTSFGTSQEQDDDAPVLRRLADVVNARVQGCEEAKPRDLVWDFVRWCKVERGLDETETTQRFVKEFWPMLQRNDNSSRRACVRAVRGMHRDAMYGRDALADAITAATEERPSAAMVELVGDDDGLTRLAIGARSLARTSLGRGGDGSFNLSNVAAARIMLLDASFGSASDGYERDKREGGRSVEDLAALGVLGIVDRGKSAEKVEGGDDKDAIRSKLGRARVCRYLLGDLDESVGV